MNIPLQFDHVSKSYGEQTVLDGLSFVMQPGEIVGLIGVNGAGKSTLIKAILDLIEIDSGQIQIFSTPHRRTEARRKLAYLAEQFKPPYFATGMDVLRLLCGIEGRRISATDIERECEALQLDSSVLQTRCASYSKGMLQKLGLIGCLINQQALLVLDEPMSGLDPLARRLFKDRLIKQRANGASVFFSTHLLEDVQTLCDRVLVLDRGAILHSGPVDSLLRLAGADNLEAGFLSLLNSSAKS